MRSALLAASILALSGCVTTQLDPKTKAEAFIGTWANPSAMAAGRFMEEYGIPDEIHANRMVWNDHGPWKRTVVYDVPPPYSGEDLDLIEQTIDYPLTEAQAAAVSAFSDRVIVEKHRLELTARAGSEEHDYLILNLADEVAQGLRSPQQAAQDYDRILELEASGKASPYTEGLVFPLAR